MPNLRVLFRESFGLVFSAVVTTSLFAGPVLGFVHQVLTKPDILAVVEAPRAAAVVDMAALQALLSTDDDEGEAEEAVEEEAPEEVTSESGSAGGSGGPGGGGSEATLAVAHESAARGGTGDGEPRSLRRVGSRESARGAAKGRKVRCDVEWPQIQKVSEGHWRVERSLVEYYGSSIARLDSLGWSGRYSENGEQGWRIGGFGCNSPLHHAGLRRGDVIQSVNGKPTRNLLQVFNHWRKLKKHDHFEVIVSRRGKTIALRYRLI